jgi:hypothetical protein
LSLAFDKDAFDMRKKILQLSIYVIFFLYLQLINLSNHGMPPMTKLCNEFVASLLTSQRKTTEKSETINLSDTVVEFSDDEMDITETDETTLKRKAYEESEKKIKEHIAKKKEADLNIENELKNMKLDEVVDFCISKN